MLSPHSIKKANSWKYFHKRHHQPNIPYVGKKEGHASSNLPLRCSDSIKIRDPHIMNELTERGINECCNFSFVDFTIITLTDFKERTPALKPLKNHSIVTSGSGTFLNRGLVDQEEVRKQQLNNLIRIVWQALTTFALQNPQSSRHQNILRIIWQLIIFHSVYFISIQIFVRF